jgi:hypothetical protein
VSKCLVSWCPEPGLDTGLLPGLCIEHRDQTLAKQKEALESTRNAAQHVPQLSNAGIGWSRMSFPMGATAASIPPGAFTAAADHARDMRLIEQMRTDYATACVHCGKRAKDVMSRMPEFVKNGVHYSVLPKETMLCIDCCVAMQDTARVQSAGSMCAHCRHVGADVRVRPPAHRVYSLHKIEPWTAVCDECCVRAARTPVE